MGIGTTPFYNETIKKFIIAFGTLFSDLTICREETASPEKHQLIKVPISYGPKNKWLSRLAEDPDLVNNVNIVLPRMAFEITDYRYDGSRHIGARGTALAGNLQGNRVRLHNPVPWDVTITLSTMCKTQEDSLQILEQILPYFAPYLTVDLEILTEFNVKKAVPLLLAGVSVEDNYQGGLDDFRVVIQNFTFVAQLDLFGPIMKPNGVIKHSIANVAQNMKKQKGALDLNYQAKVDPIGADSSDPYTVLEKWFDEKDF